jgi:SAM-dependent methyltransferase
MITLETQSLSERVPGSFRDPSGYVFRRQGRVFRAIDGKYHQVVSALEESGLLRELTTPRSVIGTSLVKDEQTLQVLRAEHPGFEHFLEHEPIATIIHPSEWCVSMLADAAVHTLELQTRLLSQGFSLKDATAYNIQFLDGRPVFIDLPSIERPARLDVWFALGQFSRMFLFPLLLTTRKGWDLRSYFLGALGGRDVEQVARSFGRLERFGPAALLDLTLPLYLNRQANANSSSARRETLERPNPNPQAQLVNLSRLGAKVRRLAAKYRPSGVWADYTATCTYDKEAEAGKKALVREFLQQAQPRSVLDVGCNPGDYSELAAAGGARVFAIDSDHDAIELLYRRLRGRPSAITPMVVDLADPTPATGYRNRERAGFLDRIDVDCVLALAVLHHLHVSGNLPLAAIRDLLHEIAGETLIVEFVPTNDPMFQKLMKFRVNLFGGLTRDSCRQVFCERFAVLREASIPHSARTLWLLKRI